MQKNEQLTCCSRLIARRPSKFTRNYVQILARVLDLSQEKGLQMSNYYYINNNNTFNPGWHHEVHTKAHAEQLGIDSKTYLGIFDNEIQAVAAGKKVYSDADGCATCCPLAHKG